MTVRVLLVDDHEANRSVLRRRLERRGIVVDEAADGAEAVAMVARSAPSFVVMDLSMPGMNGVEAFTRIRAMPHAARVPVVALTAHAVEDVRQKCLDTGFDAFMTKPIDFVMLMSHIQMLAGDTWA